jgi:hypothetical protein
MISIKIFKISLIFIGLFFLFGLFGCCRYFFGTYSLFEAAEIYNTLAALDKKYKMLFIKRENLRYHIGSAEARGMYVCGWWVEGCE